MSKPERAALAFLLPALLACGSPGNEILVSAAASLTDAFADIETSFEAMHPGVAVTVNLGGSASLARQILEGAPIDVFASASPAHMTRVATAGVVAGAPHTFARNLLAIAVPPGNPAGIEGLPAFAREDLLLGICAADVPCGDLARRALRAAGVAASIDTEEPNVRALLTRIELGELDAGIVYATDIASAAGHVEGIDIPESLNMVTEYPIAVLADAPNPTSAQTFVEFVLSPDGQAILAGHGFAAPGPAAARPAGAKP